MSREHGAKCHTLHLVSMRQIVAEESLWAGPTHKKRLKKMAREPLVSSRHHWGCEP